jgi:glyoxylase-like metal-dependent hydrolase (beta-lactamase superfamily II)
MILEHSRDPAYLSNAWLVGDRPGGRAVLIDAGAPRGPIDAALRRHGLTLTHVLLTHAHGDHTVHAAAYHAGFGAQRVGHADEGFAALEHTVADGDRIRTGDLDVRVLHVPGHTRGQLAFSVAGVGTFTGDTLFRGTVGGTRGPGHATFDDLRSSILDRLLTLPDETVLYPGHMDPTTVGEERTANPFVRLWTGASAVSETACTALGREATLLLRAPDYDGGTKCQVRWADGSQDVVAGSRVTGD